METSDDPDSSIFFRSVERGRYIAGFDALPGMGVSLPDRPTGNQVVEWGYTDFNNGYVVGEDADGLYTALYVDGERTQVRRREDWLDPLYEVLDPSRLHIYRMPFRWYGAGPFKLQVSAVIGETGQMVEADITDVQPESQTITRDPNQPLSIRVQNNGTAEPFTALVAGRQFFVAGDYNPSRRLSSQSRLDQSVGSDWEPLIAFRQKTEDDSPYDTITVRLQGVGIITQDDLVWQVRVLADVEGGEWIAPDGSDDGDETAMEYNISATGYSNGIKIYEGIIAGGSGNTSGASPDSVPSIDIPGGGQAAVLIARTVSGNSDVSSVVRVREEW